MSVAWSICQRLQNASHEVATCTDQAGGWKTDPRGKDSQPFKVQWFWCLYSLKDLFVFNSNLRDICFWPQNLRFLGTPAHWFICSTWRLRHGKARRGPRRTLEDRRGDGFGGRCVISITSLEVSTYRITFLDIHWNFPWILISIIGRIIHWLDLKVLFEISHSNLFPCRFFLAAWFWSGLPPGIPLLVYWINTGW